MTDCLEKTADCDKLGSDRYVDSSTIYKSVVPGAIDRVFTEIGEDGYPIIKIRVRSERVPNIGDIFSYCDDNRGTIDRN